MTRTFSPTPADVQRDWVIIDATDIVLGRLASHAATLLRGKIRNYSRLVRERGRMFLSHMQNWYTEERWISFAESGAVSVEVQVTPNITVDSRVGTDNKQGVGVNWKWDY